MADESNLTDAEIQRRMEAGIRRALNTLPTPTKELVGKSERVSAQKESRVRKSTRSKPENP